MPPSRHYTYVENALTIALEAHRGQKSFSGRPYVFHPIRLMEQMSTDEERCVALLHDVVEDSDVALADLRNWFPANVVNAVAALTRPDGMPYLTYIQEQVLPNPLAVKVKLADLRDNMRVERLPKVTEGALRRLKKYHEALTLLGRSPLC